MNCTSVFNTRDDRTFSWYTDHKLVAIYSISLCVRGAEIVTLFASENLNSSYDVFCGRNQPGNLKSISNYNSIVVVYSLISY